MSSILGGVPKEICLRRGGAKLVGQQATHRRADMASVNDPTDAFVAGGGRNFEGDRRELNIYISPNSFPGPVGLPK